MNPGPGSEMNEELQDITRERRRGRRSIWRRRGLRFATGLNVCLSLALAFVVVVMVNYLAHRHYHRRDVSWRSYYRLSEKTLSMLGGLTSDVKVIAFFEGRHDVLKDIGNLLEEYEYAASRFGTFAFTVEIVDRDRDLARAREVARDYDVANANVVIFESGGRRKYVELADIVDYDVSLDGRHMVRRLAGFKGERGFTSAIMSVAQDRTPVVYFLVGHGERGVSDYSKQSGYSTLARSLRRDNLDVRPLLLAGHESIPDDCDALVLAGPDRKLARAEVEMLSAYLDRNGRLMCLLDPATTTGLERLLHDWGVRPGVGVAVGLTLTGRELVVRTYGEHPVTRGLRDIATMFYMPRSVNPVEGHEANESVAADRPRVTVLASNTRKGWEETDLSQSPPRYDPDNDVAGPIPIAVAVERGPVSGIAVHVRPTRMVVIGDSYFVANATLDGGVGGNLDFFSGALNWLLERDTIVPIGPRDPRRLSLGMTRTGIRSVYAVVVGGIPALAAIVGLIVWLRRRR